MNYHKIEKFSTNNGKGIRCVLWCSGCSLHCKNCHNPETWNEKSGLEWSKEAEDELFSALSPNYINGITYSGGHPLEQYNIETITKIVKRIKEKFPNKTQWLYTGYLWEDIKNLEIIKYLDVIIDGPYIDELRNITLKFRGSSNQRIIDVQKSLKENKIVLWEDK
jgi:anaerobic ribonucleoside-triphosphate reductase activating protein